MGQGSHRAIRDAGEGRRRSRAAAVNDGGSRGLGGRHTSRKTNEPTTCVRISTHDHDRGELLVRLLVEQRSSRNGSEQQAMRRADSAADKVDSARRTSGWDTHLSKVKTSLRCCFRSTAPLSLLSALETKKKSVLAVLWCCGRGKQRKVRYFGVDTPPLHLLQGSCPGESESARVMSLSSKLSRPPQIYRVQPRT